MKTIIIVGITLLLTTFKKDIMPWIFFLLLSLGVLILTLSPAPRASSQVNIYTPPTFRQQSPIPIDTKDSLALSRINKSLDKQVEKIKDKLEDGDKQTFINLNATVRNQDKKIAQLYATISRIKREFAEQDNADNMDTCCSPIDLVVLRDSVSRERVDTLKIRLNIFGKETSKKLYKGTFTPWTAIDGR